MKDEVGLESPSPHYGSLMLGAADSGAKGLKPVAKYPAGTGQPALRTSTRRICSGLDGCLGAESKAIQGGGCLLICLTLCSFRGRHGQYQTGRCSGHVRYLDVDTRSAAAATRAHGRGREQMHSAWQQRCFSA